MHILLISDNRQLIKRIYPYFADSEKYQVFSTRNSFDYIDNFMKCKPAFVVLDRETIAPYQNILDQIEPLGGCLGVILLNEERKAVKERSGLQCILKGELTGELLLGMLENLADANKVLDEQAAPDCPPFALNQEDEAGAPVQLMMLQFNWQLEEEAMDDVLCLVKSIYSTTLFYELLIRNEKQLLFVLDPPRQGGADCVYALADSLVCQLSATCTILFSGYISRKEIFTAYSLLEKFLPLTYFFAKKAVQVQRLSAQSGSVTIEHINTALLHIAQCLMEGRNAELEMWLRELLFHLLGDKLDRQGVFYFTRMFAVLEKICCEASGMPPEKGAPRPSSIEEDFENILARSMRALELIKCKPISPLAKSALLYLFEKYRMEDISLDSMADEFGITKIYLSRVLKKELSVTFLDVLHLLRMQTAKHLLIFTDLKITEISSKIGYRDAHYFSRLFKSRFELSPESYRKKTRELNELEKTT